MFSCHLLLNSESEIYTTNRCNRIYNFPNISRQPRPVSSHRNGILGTHVFEISIATHTENRIKHTDFAVSPDPLAREKLWSSVFHCLVDRKHLSSLAPYFELTRKVPILIVRKVFRKIEAVETAEGAGAIVKRVFPTGQLKHFDPFPLLDEFNIEPPAGFPEHPHGGFEAVTYMLQGGFHHTDNLGNDSTVMAGGAQRFTAGKPIMHSELPGTEGSNRGLQLWIRLPTKLRDLEPTYQQVDPKDIPERDTEDPSSTDGTN